MILREGVRYRLAHAAGELPPRGQYIRFPPMIVEDAAKMHRIQYLVPCNTNA